MQIIKTAEGLLTALAQRKASVGLVPTMGALHQGHLSLIKRAISENETVVVSIYINPTQFDRKEDLTKYPRTLAADLILLESLSKDLIIYTPSDETLYPQGIVSKNYDFGSLATHMEGASRPGHFNGVATVVEALFKRVKPHKAYFGEKDFQQLQIINALNQQLNMGIEIIGCPIERTAEGLALSSRNTLLSEAQKKKAAQIYQTLYLLIDTIDTWSVNQMEHFFKTKIEALAGYKVDYFAVAAVTDLVPVKTLDPTLNYRLFAAVFVGNIRLIDNLELVRK